MFGKTGILKKSMQRFQECEAQNLGAALAYFSIFALVPLLTVLMIIISIFIGREVIQSEILSAIKNSVGDEAAIFLSEAFNKGGDAATNIWRSIMGVSVLIAVVIGITTQLQSSLDKIFGYEYKKISFIKYFREKIASFSMVLILAFLLLVFMIISTTVSLLSTLINSFIVISPIATEVINFILSFFFVLGFAFINFKFLPHVKISARSAFYGSALTALLFILGKFGLNIYLSFWQPGTAYGAAGVVLLILLWIYYSAQILFFGACFSYVLEKNSDTKPNL
jgi:membrane protein